MHVVNFDIVRRSRNASDQFNRFSTDRASGTEYLYLSSLTLRHCFIFLSQSKLYYLLPFSDPWPAWRITAPPSAGPADTRPIRKSRTCSNPLSSDERVRHSRCARKKQHASMSIVALFGDAADRTNHDRHKDHTPSPAKTAPRKFKTAPRANSPGTDGMWEGVLPPASRMAQDPGR